MDSPSLGEIIGQYFRAMEQRILEMQGTLKAILDALDKEKPK